MKKNIQIAFPILTTQNDQNNRLQKTEFFNLSDFLTNNFYQSLDLATETPDDILGDFIILEDQYGNYIDHIFGICINDIKIEKIKGRSKRGDFSIVYQKVKERLYSLSYDLYQNQYISNDNSQLIVNDSIEAINQSVFQITIGFGEKKRIYEANIMMYQNYFEYTCDRLFKEEQLTDLAFIDETKMIKH